MMMETADSSKHCYLPTRVYEKNIPNENTLQNIEGARNLNADTEDDDLCLILNEEYECVWQSH